MSLARSRPIEPSRAMTAYRRVIHRSRRGTSRTASASACVGVGGETLAGRDGIAVGRGVPKPVDGGVDGRRIHHPCRRGQLVLVVAAVTVIGEERVDRCLAAAVPRVRAAIPSRPTSNVRSAPRRPRPGDRGSTAAAPAGRSRCRRCRRRCGSPVPAATPGDRGRSSSPLGAPASMLNCSSRFMLAAWRGGNVSSHASSSSSVAVRQIGHRGQPRLRLGRGPRRARRDRACASA